MRFIDEYVLGAIRAAVDPETCKAPFSDRACAARERLREVLDQACKNNAQARDFPRLREMAAEIQNAANPRPLSVLFSNLTHTVMREGGNPAYQNSAPIRLVLHQLLNLLDHSSLPAYDRDVMLFHRDMEECEKALNISPLPPDRTVDATVSQL